MPEAKPRAIANGDDLIQICDRSRGALVHTRKSLRSLNSSQFLRVSEIIEVLGGKLFIRWQTVKLSGSSKGQLLGTLIPLFAK